LIIVDASVLAAALADDGPLGDMSRTTLALDPHWAAPGHLIVETFAALRGLHLGGKVGSERAMEALNALAASSIEVVSTAPLLTRMWQLRANVTGYDAAYVAAAEVLDCPLVTADSRLASADGIRCEVNLVSPTSEGFTSPSS
jgi:predicted nucleic acid-binding protein